MHIVATPETRSFFGYNIKTAVPCAVLEYTRWVNLDTGLFIIHRNVLNTAAGV